MLLKTIAKKYFSIPSPAEPIFTIDTIVSPDEYATVYVDMDNTLCLWKFFTPHICLLDFLIVSRQRGKKIIIITKSITPPEVSLKSVGINPDFFDEIIVVPEDKPQYMTTNSIFIDDKETERLAAESALGIKTFDPDTYIFRRISDHALGPVDSALLT